MRILLLADIHANWPALQAIQEPFDVCLSLGDLVDYGLEPGPCIEWVRQRATYSVRGNHDHGVAQHVRVNGKQRLQVPDRRHPPRHAGTHLRRAIAAFWAPCRSRKRLTLDNTRFLLVHATPRDPLDEYAIADVDFWSRRLRDVDAHVICVGHTHHPYVLEVGDKLVINPGSVGQPRDGDPRASYAIIENQRVELQAHRVSRRRDGRARCCESNLPEPAKALLVEVFRTGGLAKPDSGKLKLEPPTPPLEEPAIPPTPGGEPEPALG